MKPVIAILGLGCLGTLVAYHLRQYQPLHFPRQANGRKADDVCYRQLMSADKPPHVLAQMALNPVEEQTLDWLIICTKAGDTATIWQQLSQYPGSIRNLLLLQNGMGQQQVMADWLAQNQHLSAVQNCQLWVGSATEGAFRLERNTYVYAGQGQYRYGLWQPNEVPHKPQNNELPAPLQLEHDMPTQLFRKLAINAVINPLTAYHGCLNGELVTQANYHPQLLGLAAEVSDIFTALNWPGADDLLNEVIVVAQATAKNRSSTLQDVENGYRTELASITGFIIDSAQQAGLSAPKQINLLQQLANQGVRY